MEHWGGVEFLRKSPSQQKAAGWGREWGEQDSRQTGEGHEKSGQVFLEVDLEGLEYQAREFGGGAVILGAYRRVLSREGCDETGNWPRALSGAGGCLLFPALGFQAHLGTFVSQTRPKTSSEPFLFH